MSRLPQACCGRLESVNPEIVSIVLTGIGVLLGVWWIQAHYETRNEAAHSELRGLLVKVAEDVACLRGRQDERDRGREGR